MGTVPFEFWPVNDLATLGDRMGFFGSCTSGIVVVLWVLEMFRGSKRCAETLFFDYQRQHRLEIKVARIFNTFGPRMRADDGRVVSNFIVQALRGEPLTIYGDGSQTRSFCYVEDLVDGLMKLMKASESKCGSSIDGPTDISCGEQAHCAAQTNRHSQSRICRFIFIFV